MNEKVKEMKRAEKQKRNLLRQGGSAAAVAALSSSASNFASSQSSTQGSVSAFTAGDFISGAAKTTAYKSSAGYGASAVGGSGKALKLGSKATTDENSFLQQLRQEGQDVSAASEMKSKVGDQSDTSVM